MKRIIILIIVFLLPTRAPARDAEVSATVDRVSITAQDMVRLSVCISGGEGQVDVSSIRDFKVVPEGTSTGLQIVNGHISREVVHNYALIPIKEGQLNIPALKVIVSGGKEHLTDPIEISVGAMEKSNDDTADLFVRAEVSSQTPYEGQQIVYTFGLHSAVPLSNVRFQPPSFEGFSARQIEDQRSYKKIISNREYQINEVFFALTPLKAQKLSIEPAVLSCEVLIGDDLRRSFPFGSIMRDSFFDRGKRRRKILRSEPVSVEVKALPEYKGPGFFSGLVGEFQIQASMENKIAKVGDSVTLSVVISGAGNIMDARLPEFAVPDGLKVYEDAPEENISADAGGYRGKKVFRTALVASEPGSFELGPIALKYFDPAKGVYETTFTEIFELNVSPSGSNEKMEFAAAGKSFPTNAAKTEVEFIGRDILPLKESMDALHSAKTISFSIFIVYLLLPSILYVFFWGVFRLTRKEDAPAEIMARRAEQAIKEAKNFRDNPDQRLLLLYRALISAIWAKAGAKGESLTYAEAEEILAKNRVDSATAEEAKNLLMKIESERYSGMIKDSSSVDDLLRDVAKIIHKLAS